MSTVTVPTLTGYDLCRQYRSALRTVRRLRGTEDNRITLNMQNAKWVLPSFIAPVAVECNRLAGLGKEIETRLPGGWIRTYLEQIHFPFGTKDPIASFDNNLPLCQLADSNNPRLAEAVGQEIRELIKQNYRKLADGKLTALTYPINEIVGNVHTHSSCDFGSVLVQNYPNRDCMDVCIADDGVSIPGSFDEYGIEYDSHEDANKKALVDGVSTRQGDSSGDRGFGLRTTKNMVCEGTHGEMFLSSRDSTLYKDEDGELERRARGFDWSGTVFSARICFPLDDDFSAVHYV